MKILFLLTYYYPHWTGLTQYAQRLAEGLSKKGFTIDVLTTAHADGLKEEEMIAGVSVTRKPVLFSLSRTLVSPLLVLAMFGAIVRSDKVVIYLPFAEVLIATIAAKIFGKKVFLVHNGDLNLPKGSFFNGTVERFYIFMTYWAMKLAERIIIQTEDYANHSVLLSQFKCKWAVVLPLYPTLSVDEGVKKKFLYAIGKKSVCVGFAGRFVQEKGFDVLFEAIPSVLKKYPDARFVFAGERNIPYESFFESQRVLFERHKDSIVFLGKLGEREMGSFYGVLDVFVISSRSDCFPSVLVEALLSGVPAVVTDIPGARWPVLKSGMGDVVSAEDPRRMGAGIVHVFENYDRYVKKKKEVLQLFDYEKTLERYIALFTKGN